MKNIDSHSFTSESNHNQMFNSTMIIRDVNKVMYFISKSFSNQHNIISRSFRVSYIYQLQKDTNDIEFVKQLIGH